MGEKFKTASADPADQTAGGFLDDVMGTIMKARYTNDFDYQGKRDAVPALRLDIYVDGAPKIRTEHLTAGNKKKARASKDGKQLLTTSGSIGSGTKVGIFNASLGLAGYPKKKWAEVTQDVSLIEGLYCRFKQVPMPRNSDDEEGAKVRQALSVSEIEKLPWENKGFRKRIEAELEEAGEAEDKDASNDDEDSDKDSDDDSDDEDTEDSDSDDSEDEDEKDEDTDDAEDEDEEEAPSKFSKETATAISTLLKDKKHAKGITVDELPSFVFQAVKASKNKRQIVELAGDEEWLAKNFKIAKGKVVPKK